MSSEKITAEVRTEFGKGAARRIRRDDKVPAVALRPRQRPDPPDPAGPRHDDGAQARRHERPARARRRRRPPARADQAGPGRPDPPASSSTSTSWPSAAARRSPSTSPSHRRRRGRPDALVVLENNTIQVEAEATHIPELIEIDIEGQRIGTQIHASDLKLPKGTTLVADAEPADRQHHRSDHRRGAGGRAGGGRGRGRHRARAQSDEEKAERGRRVGRGLRQRVIAHRGVAARPTRRRQRRGGSRGAVCVRRDTGRTTRTCGWSSGWATPVRRTPGTGTTSATSSSTSWPTGWVAGFRAHKSGRADVVEGRLGAPGPPAPRVVLARPRCYMNETGGPV